MMEFLHDWRVESLAIILVGTPIFAALIQRVLLAKEARSRWSIQTAVECLVGGLLLSCLLVLFARPITVWLRGW